MIRFKKCPRCGHVFEIEPLRFCPTCGLDLQLAANKLADCVAAPQPHQRASAWQRFTKWEYSGCVWAGAIVFAIMASFVYEGLTSDTTLPAAATPQPSPIPTATTDWYHDAQTRVAATQGGSLASYTVPAVAIGTPTTYSGVSITLVDISTHDMIYTGHYDSPGWQSVMRPNPGDQIIDLLFSVRGSSIAAGLVGWKDLGIQEADGSSWYTSYGGSSDRDGAARIGDLDMSRTFYLSQVRSIRLAFFVSKRPQRLLFYIRRTLLISFDNP